MQRAQQQPVGLKYGYLHKCSSKFKIWDNTWFVLGTQELTYYKRGSNSPKTIDLQQSVSIVSADVEDAKRPHSFKLTSPSFPRPLILAAETSTQADEWIAAIRAVATLYAPPPESPNGPPKLTQDNKNMLDCTLRIVQFTGKLVSAAAMSVVPGIYSRLLLDSLSISALMCGTTGRVVVYKPKVQSGGQRFTQSVTETMALVVKYKYTYQSARKKAALGSAKGKGTEDPLSDVTGPLESLIEVIERTVSNWMPNTLDSELTKPLDDISQEEREEEEEREREGEKGEKEISPYISPFFIDSSSSPPPCKKHWELLVDECSGLVSYMETLPKGDTTYRQPSAFTLDQARLFLSLSRRVHEIPHNNSAEEDIIGLSAENFLLMKQHLLGAASAIDYHTAIIGLSCTDSVPPQIIDVISHAHSISSALCKLPRSIKKHRTKTLVSAVENIGSFSFSLSKLISQMVDLESFFAKDARSVLLEEVHAVKYLAIHMLGLCAVLVEGNFNVVDILPLTDTAKLLALGVSNVLESIRKELSPSLSPSSSSSSSSLSGSSSSIKLSSSTSKLVNSESGYNSGSGSAQNSPVLQRRKLASELTDATTGSMVFWFGMVGKNSCVHLEG